MTTVEHSWFFYIFGQILHVMKRFLIMAVAILSLSVSGFAQDSRSFGFRLGYPEERITYQHFMGDPHFLEVDLGVDMVKERGFKATSTFNWVIAQPSWAGGDWTWYLGPGTSVGYVYNHPEMQEGNDSPAVMVAVAFQVGCEFAPARHFAISADICPMYGYHFGTKCWYKAGLYGLIPSISVKYLF